MRLRTTIRAQMLVLTIVPVLVLVIGIAIAMQSSWYALDVSAKSDTTVFSAAQTVLENMLDAETGARGYLETERPVFLQPYNSALTAVPASVHRLSTLVVGDVGEIRQVRSIQALSSHDLTILASEITAMRAGRPELVRADVARGAGKRTMDKLRSEIGKLEADVQRDAAAKLALTKTAALRTRNTLAFCIAFGVFFAGAASWQIRRAVGRRVDLLVQKAQRLAAGDDIGPRLGGSDEISDLDRAFHHMAEQLAERTADLERYRLLAERTQCLMLFARMSDGRILHANAAALAAYRYSLAEIQLLTFDELRSGEMPNAAAQQHTTASVALAYETDQRRSDGSTFPGEVTVEGRSIAGEPMLLMIVRDISERRHAENLLTAALGAARNAARAKADFLATMSHEIRTPMNAVIGMTELLLQTALTEEQRDSLQIVNVSGMSLLRIIDDVLDFSKIEAGKLNIEIIDFPLTTTIESVAMTLAAQARTQGLVLSVFADPRAPATLYGDPGRIRQVLTNLVGNAIKFTKAGSVTLSAEVTAATNDWCDVRFSVADTGIGIAELQLARIFEPFAQADASTTRVYGGSGLGLTICYQLVELMGGRLRVDSVPSRGSTFSFVLRLRAGEASAPIDRGDLRALVVERSGKAPSEIMRYLSAWGIDVRNVSSAAAALASCAAAANEHRSYDITTVDADLLGAEALSLGAALAADARTATARRILVGSSNPIEHGRAAIAAGFSAYLMRPLRQSQLFDSVMNIEPVSASPSIELPNEPSRLRILLAEDNIINQRVALQQLHRLGYEAHVVADGRAALAAVISEPYDVILMDCFMPEMDGYAATKAIRRHQAHTGDYTPIIAMTANAQSGDRSTCIAAGMNDYLSKPVTLAALRDVLKPYRLAA